VTCDRSVVFFTNKTDSHDITEILLKVALNTIRSASDKIYQLLDYGRQLKYC
jgi:hypothetical protein